MPASTLCSLSAAAKLDGNSLGLPSSSDGHAARDTRRFINRWGFTWNVPVSYFRYKQGAEELVLPYLSPLKLIPHLLERAPEILMGGCDTVEGQRLLSTFWSTYRECHPTHTVFQEHADSLSTVLPLAVHGDEGRGVRKGNTCLLTVESVLGMATKSNMDSGAHYAACKCCSTAGLDMSKQVLTKQPLSAAPPLAAQQAHNICGHPFLNKLLIFMMPTKLAKDVDLLLGFIEHISKELKQLFFEGVYARGRFWHGAVVGLKGDMVWFKKIGRLNRCFSNLAHDACMCHECLAGTLRQPYEDLREQPSWSRSIFAARPWGLQGPSFAAVPYDREHPEKIMQRDTFHNTKIGIYRDFVGSTVLLLCELGYWHDSDHSNAREHLLNRAHGSFKMYCLAVHRPAALHSFSTSNFNVPTKAKYAWISSKGSDTILLMEWLAVQTRAFLNDSVDPSHAEVLETMNRAARAGNDWMKALYKHGIFQSRQCALALYREERRFLLNYNKLAHMCLNVFHFPGYAQKPKLHMMAHTALEQQQWLKQGLQWIPSPILFACDANEDMVGKISRISRRTHQKTTCEATLEMFLIKNKALYRRWKLGTSTQLSRKRKHAEM